MQLDKKTAVITGGAGGIGLGIARACLARGMRVVVSDVDASRLAETADALRSDGGRVHDHACDVRSLEAVEGLRDAALEAFGQVDLVCNNAGIGLARSVLDTADGDWELLFDVNVGGVVNGIRTFLPLMVEQGSGHLNATASLSGLVGDPGLVTYDGTKFAVVGMMEGLALELLHEHPDVTCSVLCPGPVATDLIASSGKHLSDAGSSDMLSTETGQEVADYLAAGLNPDEVGRIAVDGIAAAKFWLLTHPELTFEIMEPRFEAMKAGRLYVAGDWTEQR